MPKAAKSKKNADGAYSKKGEKTGVASTNPYLFYLKEQRPELTAALQKTGKYKDDKKALNNQVMKDAGAQWKELSEDEQEAYRIKAKAAAQDKAENGVN